MLDLKIMFLLHNLIFVEYFFKIKNILYDVNHWLSSFGFGMKFKQTDCTFLFENIFAKISCILIEIIIITANI